MNIYGSILDTVKTGLGYTPDYTPFDGELIIYINNALRTLNQLNVGERSFVVTSKDNTWEEFLTSDEEVDKFSEIHTYVILKVKLLHDPPSNSFLVDAINKSITELEWRLNADAEFYV